ncbi:hypothetical protein NHG29_01895 [Aerococcaceae bacterium NML160702]|nr:hypothetical protein [Aerococcaceae bacterium NML160702]
MNEKAVELTIADLALQIAQEKLNANTFKVLANEQIANLEAVVKDQNEQIEKLQQELEAYREGAGEDDIQD